MDTSIAFYKIRVSMEKRGNYTEQRRTNCYVITEKADKERPTGEADEM